ncbi:MAG: PEP-CTERM sorting domain-containing protein [Anaerohalosphaera sp.]|nr:PEP-CTERM sorting domain-containing protein [Anaerohalosphaera sp.]
MKRLAVVLAVCAIAASSIAGVNTDINFSTDQGGSWQYDGVGTFSFVQPVGIDDIQCCINDQLVGQFVHIPNFTLSSPVIAGGMVEAGISPDTLIAIKDAGGNVLLEGTLGNGDFIAFNTISGAYSEFLTDIIVTYVSNTIGSDMLDTISIGTELDFNITLQHRTNFADIIGQEIETGGTLSGSMSVVPEPATMLILGLGGLMLRRRR